MSNHQRRRFKYALFGADNAPIPGTGLCEVHFAHDANLATAFADHPDHRGFQSVTFDEEIACRVCGYVDPERPGGGQDADRLTEQPARYDGQGRLSAVIESTAVDYAVQQVRDLLTENPQITATEVLRRLEESAQDKRIAVQRWDALHTAERDR
jgi:hypothetical protein